uniref:Uncharacterized protein n=1 Tax=Anguilla anguilla TaxID=7936 RepID=A0A0E9UG88_ANGAN
MKPLVTLALACALFSGGNTVKTYSCENYKLKLLS